VDTTSQNNGQQHDDYYDKRKGDADQYPDVQREGVYFPAELIA